MATKPDQSRRERLFRPLTVEQQHAIDLLILGHTDAEVAEAVGVARTTISEWRVRHPLFGATLEQRRAEIWRAPQEKLRSLASTAVDTLAGAVQAGDLKASIELLKCIGMYGGLVNAIGEQDPHKRLAHEVDRQLSATGMSPHDQDIHELLTKLENPAYAAMRAAIQAELEREYLLPDDRAAGSR
jgi:hypothetical protein